VRQDLGACSSGKIGVVAVAIGASTRLQRAIEKVLSVGAASFIPIDGGQAGPDPQGVGILSNGRAVEKVERLQQQFLGLGMVLLPMIELRGIVKHGDPGPQLSRR
jgi:hypothetical protein